MRISPQGVLFFYCNLKAPNFYREDREYLVELCNAFQSFYESDEEVMIINLPPSTHSTKSPAVLDFP